MNSFKVGILSIQGNVEEHRKHTIASSLNLSLNCYVEKVKRPSELKSISGLIIPGGESTTISKLMRNYGIFEEIKKLAKEGLPLFGTCAGTVLLAETIIDRGDYDVQTLQLMNMRVGRNVYGRQRESFEDNIELKDNKFPGVFIRAPTIVNIWGDCNAYGWYDSKIVMAVQHNLIATTFHPELTNSTYVHELFLKKALKYHNDS